MVDAQIISQILKVIPNEWLGTTFKNHQLLGREGFERNLNELLSKKSAQNLDEEPITASDLENLGNAEDYLRVATNLSTLLEYFLARQHGLNVREVFSFGSTVMPVIAVVLTTQKRVHLYSGEETCEPIVSAELSEVLKLFGGHLELHRGPASPHPDEIVLSSQEDKPDATIVDGWIQPNILYLLDSAKIASDPILVIRKRLATPLTTPVVVNLLQQLARVEETHEPEPSVEDQARVFSHLQTLSGTEPDPNANPVLFTAGLPSTASLWFSLIDHGGAELLMASTAYGGSSQLVDLLCDRSRLFRKHTFGIQGLSTSIVESIQAQLERITLLPDLLPTLVLFVEIPTNPDMKVPGVHDLALMVKAFTEMTGREVILLIDTTFAPGSGVMKKFHDLAPDLPVLAFISLSKSVTRGITTGGALVANHTERAKSLLDSARAMGRLLDTSIKPDQMNRLIANHQGVEQRCDAAYRIASQVGERLQKAVRDVCSYEMPLAFPTPEHAKLGFTSSTFSFNLPSVPGASADVNAALAQKFVDLICVHSEVFKPCVSFGQDNGLVYATVPATSTQGAIKEEDKAKQAVGGVQLVRLSFPPTIDVQVVGDIVESAVRALYPQKSN